MYGERIEAIMAGMRYATIFAILFSYLAYIALRGLDLDWVVVHFCW